MRILALISQLSSGGAERVLCKVTTYLADRHDVTLMTWGGVEPFYPLSEKVKILKVDEFGPLRGAQVLGIIKRVTAVRRQTKLIRPDVLLSFMDTMNILALTACKGLRVPIVISERTDPHHHDIGRAKNMARRLLYPRARHIVVQTQRAASYFSIRLRKKISIIANPIAIPAISAEPERAGKDGRFRIIAVGRLGPEKLSMDLLNHFL